MTQQIVKISLLQHAASTYVNSNIDKVYSLIEKAADDGANIICLQELCRTKYFCNRIDQANFKLAIEIPGELPIQFKELAKKYSVVIIIPIFEKEAPGIYYNTIAVIDADGSYLGKYRKTHIPDDPGFHEKYYFTPGDLGYKVFKTRYGNIGTLICWDQWFPEAARITAMRGADILVYPTAIGTLSDETAGDKKRFINAWQTIQCSHAIANGCYVAGINRVGTESDTTFWGRSFIAGPFGKIIAEAGDREEVLTQTVDFSTIENQRQTWPFFRDRRVDTYQSIGKKFLKNLSD